MKAHSSQLCHGSRFAIAVVCISSFASSLQAQTSVEKLLRIRDPRRTGRRLDRQPQRHRHRLRQSGSHRRRQDGHAGAVQLSLVRMDDRIRQRPGTRRARGHRPEPIPDLPHQGRPGLSHRRFQKPLPLRLRRRRQFRSLGHRGSHHRRLADLQLPRLGHREAVELHRTPRSQSHHQIRLLPIRQPGRPRRLHRHHRHR